MSITKLKNVISIHCVLIITHIALPFGPRSTGGSLTVPRLILM